MKIQNKAIYWVGAVLLSIVFLVLLTIANYQYARNNPGGTDFLVHWLGTRAYFTEGISPYSDQVAVQIQNMVYGRTALPGEHELRVAYPFYSVILFFPLALIQDFTVARAVWMTILEIGLIALTLVSIQCDHLATEELDDDPVIGILSIVVSRLALIDQWQCGDPDRAGGSRRILRDQKQV